MKACMLMYKRAFRCCCGRLRCLEGLFDTWGVFGHGFNNNLTLGGPTPIGARQATLSQEVASHLAEVALNEQVTFTLPRIVSFE